MYYEEKIINGLLHSRSSPNGKWIEVNNNYGKAVNALFVLTDDERFETLQFFCRHCGNRNPQCNCWNDQ